MSGRIMTAATLAIGMGDYASGIYQSESEPFVVEEGSKKKPIIVGKPVDEQAPELPEIKEIVRAAASAEKPKEGVVIELEETTLGPEEAATESKEPPPQEDVEEKPRIKKPSKPKAKPPEKVEEKVQSRPPEKVEMSQTRLVEKASISLSDEAWQIVAIAGLGLLALITIRKFAVRRLGA